MVSSSILENNNSAFPILCSAGSKTSFVLMSFHDVLTALNVTLRMPFSFAEVNGKNGSLKVAKAEAIWSATNIIVLVRASSTFITFQGSSSAKYLFPSRAKFINSCPASLKR